MKHQKVIKRKTDTEQSKNMYKYAQLNRLHRDRRPQVYMYDFMYVDTDTFPVEDNFPATKTFFESFNSRISTKTLSWV